MLALALSAGSAAKAQSAGSAKPYIIGAVYDITGSASFLGIPQRNATRMLIDQVNKQGGVNGRFVELRVIDSKTNPTEAALAIKKLIEEDQVLAVLGSTTSGGSLAMLPIATEKKVPMISNGASSRIVEPVDKRKWIFKTAQSDVLEARAIVDYLVRQNLLKVAIIAANNDFGQSGINELEKLAGSAGITLASVQRYNDGDTDMTPQLMKVKESGAQVLITWGTVPGTAYVTIGHRQLGLTIPQIQSASTPAFLKMAGEAANSVLIPSGKLLVADSLPSSDPQAAVVQKFDKNYSTAFPGQPANLFAGYGNDGGLMLLEALRNAGANATAAAIRDQLEKLTNMPGVTCIFTMSPTDHNGCSPESFIWVRITNSKYHLANK
jgi:branched-chain amino acid transport system substrate-binding protein